MKRVLGLIFAMTMVSGSLFAQADIYDKYNNPHLGLMVKDFRYMVEGSDSVFSLYNLQADSLIILFYDPDCGHWKHEIKKLRKDKQLNNSIKKGLCLVMTIPPDITREEWKATVKKMPKQWINAWSEDRDDIITKYLWRVPEIFYLDKDKRVTKVEMFREDFDDE